MRLDAKVRLADLDAGIVGYTAFPKGPVFLRRFDGREIAVGVVGEELAPYFEVFALTLGAREPGIADQGVDIRLWPFNRWLTYVLIRTEFTVPPDGEQETFGEAVCVQSASRSTDVPKNVIDQAAVEVGLLFVGANESRLLVAADWFPYDLLVTQDPAVIDDFLQVCDASPVNRQRR
jgi:hypothetical protein